MCEDSENQKTLKTSLYIAIIYTFQKHSSDHVGSLLVALQRLITFYLQNMLNVLASYFVNFIF